MSINYTLIEANALPTAPGRHPNKAISKRVTVVAVDGFSVPAGVYADHVPDLFRVVAADRESVVVSYDRRVRWSRSVRTPSRCTLMETRPKC